MRRLLATVLSMALLLATIPFAVSVSAEEEKDAMDNYVLYTIHDKQQFTYIASSRVYGGAWVNNISIDMSSVEPEDLALSMRFFYEDNNDPDNTDLLANHGDDIHFADANDKRLYWKINEVKTVDGGDLMPGVWNEILLPFSTGHNYSAWDFSTEKFTFWWMEFSQVSTSTYSVRLADVHVVDTSRPAAVEEEVVWDTTYRVADIPFTLNKTLTTGANAAGCEAAVTFPTVDASAHNPETLTLLMDITYENLTNPGDTTPVGLASGQIELTSSGTCDRNELNYGIPQLRWREGTYEYAFPLASFNKTGDDIDLSSINYMRIYINNWPTAYTDRVHIAVSNVRLVDNAGAPVLPTLFSDNMMFQQYKPMNLWGWGDAGSTVTAKLYKGDTLLETVSGTADEDGRWDVAFTARKGGYDTYTIRITLGDYAWTLENVIIGELWVAGGQSNMELWIGRDMDVTAILEAANNTNIRVYCEPLRANGGTAIDPSRDVPGAYWCLGNDKASLSNVSTVGYIFAKRLQETLDVPVGFLNTALGGTVIEAWLSRETIEQNASLKTALKSYGKYFDETWWPEDAGVMTTWYNAKIAPIAGIHTAGLIWYQGESNSGYSEMYDGALAALKDSWGDIFGYPDGDMPLIFAQASSSDYGFGKATLGYLAEAMTRGWAICGPDTTAMLPLYDLPLDHMLNGETSDPVHPRIKTPVGERFALAALNMVYGGEGEYTSPVYKSMEIKDHAVYLTFDRVGDGLKTIDNTDDLHGFTIAGADNVYVNAQAEIVGKDTVKVWNNYVTAPANVMYAFDDFPLAANLANSVGIPASPFRTVKPNDTVQQQNDGTRFVEQDWMYADRDVWVYDETNVENYKYGYRPSFRVTGGDYSYDSAIRAEGIASLRVNFEGDFTVSPILTYPQVDQLQWENFKTLSVSLLNLSSTATTLSLTVTSGGKTYNVPLLDRTAEVALAASGTAFHVYTFDLTAMTLNGAAVSDPANVLSSLTAVTFNGTADGEGAVFFDGFSLGLTEAVTADAELNRDAPTVVATYDDLLALIQEAALIDTSLYTTESATLLELALDKATAVYEQTPPATLLEVTDAATALKEAIDALELLPPPKGLLGDVDGKGTVDSTDARLVLQYAVKKIGAASLDLTVADVDGSQTVDSTDARLILQLAVGKIQKFPTKN